MSTFKTHVPVGPMTDFPAGPYEGDEYFDKFDREWWKIPAIRRLDTGTGEEKMARTWPVDTNCRREVRTTGGFYLCTRGNVIPEAKSYSALTGFDSDGRPIWTPIHVALAGHAALVLIRYRPLKEPKEGPPTADFGDQQMSRIQRCAFGLPGSPSLVPPAAPGQPNVLTMAPINFTGESKT